MPHYETDQLAGTFRAPLIPLNEAVGAVRNMTLAGSALTLTLVSATDKTGDRAITVTLPSGGGAGIYAVARYRRTTTSAAPDAPTSNSDAAWSADYTAPDGTNPYSWIALKIGSGADPNDATGWQILPVDSPEASGNAGVSSIGAGTGISVNRATGAVTVSVDSVLESIRTAFNGVGVKDADSGDGGIVAVQSGTLNISVANTYSYDGEGNIRPFNLGIQTANPRIMVGIKNDLTATRSDYFVKYNGNQLTPDLGQAAWTVVSGGRTGTAQNYTFYQIRLAGVTMNAGAVALENIGQIDSRLIPHQSVSDRVEGFAIIGTTDRAPASRLPNASASAAGIISAAFYQRIAAAVQNDNPTDSALTHTQIEDADAVLLRDSSVTTGNEIAEIAFSELDERWYPQTAARTEVLDEYFDSEGWQAFAQGEIAITRVGNPPENQLFTTPGFVTTPGVPLGYDYTSAIVDVSPRPDDNRVLYMRVPLAEVDSGQVRLNLDLDGEAGSNPQEVRLNADQITAPRRFREVDRNATYVVYGLQFTSIAEDAQLQMQKYDKAQLDTDYVDVDDVFPETGDASDGDVLTLVDASENTRAWRASHATGRLGTTTLADGSGAGLFISSLTGGHRSTFTLFSPTFDADDAANQHGLALGRIKLTLSGRSSSSTGFGSGWDETHRFGGYVSYRDMQASSSFNSAAAFTSAGLAGGVALDSADYYDGGVVSGYVTAYIAKNAQNQWGYYYEYIPRTGYSGSGHSNVASDIELFYEHSGVAITPSGGSTATLQTVTLAADVVAPFPAGTGAFNTAWTDIISHTITAAQAGVNGFDIQIHAEFTGTPTTGAQRVWSEERIVRTRGAVDTELARKTTYIRNQNGVPVTQIVNENISVWDDSESGDVVKVQGRSARQVTDDLGSNGITYRASGTSFQIAHM